MTAQTTIRQALENLVFCYDTMEQHEKDDVVHYHGLDMEAARAALSLLERGGVRFCIICADGPFWISPTRQGAQDVADYIDPSHEPTVQRVLVIPEPEPSK